MHAEVRQANEQLIPHEKTMTCAPVQAQQELSCSALTGPVPLDLQCGRIRMLSCIVLTAQHVPQNAVHQYHNDFLPSVPFIAISLPQQRSN